MNRKRNDFGCNDYGDYGPCPMTKKIKSPLPAVDKLNLKSNHDECILFDEKQSTYGKNAETVGQNGFVKLAIISNLPPQVFSIILK